MSLLVLAWLSLAVTVALGQSRRTTIGVDEIRPGMRGYGLTVFRGTQPERFDVEVIDILHNFRPDMDLILIRTDHPILDHASTVAGMSGSPIYLDGRLAGAYAYGWPFGKDPVAGVTPIANMMAELHRPVRPDAFPGADKLRLFKRRAGARRRPASARLAGLSPWLGDARRGAFDPLRAHAQRQQPRPRGRGPRGLVTARTPLMLGGFGDETAQLLGDQLEPFGLMVLQAGGGARRRQARRPRFIDGGSIAVQLMRGHMTATAVGTVTHVAGSRLVAFGHSMMNAGEVGFPTATARVLHVLASENRSFKIAEATDPLGTLVHDRESSIVIDTRREAETVPVSIRVEGVPNARRTEWQVEVASHRVMTPMLVLAAIANAVRATASDQTHVILTARSRVTIEGHGTVEVEDVTALENGAGGARPLMHLRLFELMEAAFGNPFEESRVRSVDIRLGLRFARDAITIADASVTSREVDPGSHVQVHVVLRQFGRPDRVRMVPVSIPERAAGRRIEVLVQAGSAVRLEQPEPRNLGDLLRIVQNRYPSTSMAISVKLPSRGLRLRGHVVRDLPASALNTLQLQNDTGRGRPFVTYDRELVDMGQVLEGSARLRLTVREVPRQ